MSDSPSGVSDGITSAKVAFGMIVPLFYIAYLVMAVIALQKTKGSGHVRIDEEEQEEQELHNRPSIENSNSFGVDYFHSDPLRLHPP
ncbi:hypothetical protein IMSHALPRED_003919 [Imshaugia aleurites]|uniref:Uncharacterized protein n=1 Tax=Imshaugia aleurites TaxID=172621 RepID=A0A8H3I9V0_9LECA|nr:hypothetical protein IMSHALPRED_003919 [Imshaugia aleurites]